MPSEDPTCAICDDSEGENSNAIVSCDGCNLAVHQVLHTTTTAATTSKADTTTSAKTTMWDSVTTSTTSSTSSTTTLSSTTSFTTSCCLNRSRWVWMISGLISYLESIVWNELESHLDIHQHDDYRSKKEPSQGINHDGAIVYGANRVVFSLKGTANVFLVHPLIMIELIPCNIAIPSYREISNIILGTRILGICATQISNVLDQASRIRVAGSGDLNVGGST
ncbi:hypothetical protein BT96DRAFT_1051732 [Gymnopus androsaceus JB14]|uniref:Uncharacterized protein n=1 Tax=Gymnopus androsaceus JB14 TaxID=1447944 RepID=A0A6A4H571_9AGAR|nr:hypothetical protein BT96DRAFT_1051732 [Gymnopus androsaceus JB14]